jgi:hypothetical protein
VTGADFRGVDIDLLADFIGGALSGTPDESVVATLVADDPAWRAAYESLGGGMAAVSDELGRFEPEPMPDDVIARLDAALAAASPAPRLTLVQDDDAHDVRPEREAVRERGRKAGPARRLRWLTPIAIAAGVVAFVGFGLDYLAGRESSQSDSAASSSAGEAQNAAAMPAVPQLLSSGTDYTESTLATEPPAPLVASGKASRSMAQSDSAPMAAPDNGNLGIGGPGALSRLRDSTALQECLDAIAAQNSEGPIYPQSVDFALFNGQPAVVVRFSASNGSWAWAAGADCGVGGAADTLGNAPVR